MKNYRTLAILLGALAIGAATSPAQAQSKRAPAEIQKDYDQFIVKFRAALKAKDVEAVTNMTKFPFFRHDLRDAAYFRKNVFSAILPPKIRDCIARGKGDYDRSPDGAENFIIFCGDDLFYFTRTPGGFRFAEVGVND